MGVSIGPSGAPEPTGEDSGDELAARRRRKEADEEFAELLGMVRPDFADALLLAMSQQMLHHAMLPTDEAARRESVRVEALSLVRVALPESYRADATYGRAVARAHAALMNFRYYGRRSGSRRVERRTGALLAPDPDRLTRWDAWRTADGGKLVRGSYTLEENYRRRAAQVAARVHALWVVLAPQTSHRAVPLRIAITRVSRLLKREPACWDCGGEKMFCSCAWREAEEVRYIAEMKQRRSGGAPGAAGSGG
jgi:hypothetical protein